MRKKEKKRSTLLFIFILGRRGLSVSSCCQYEEFVNLENVDMYIFY